MMGRLAESSTVACYTMHAQGRLHFSEKCKRTQRTHGAAQARTRGGWHSWRESRVACSMGDGVGEV